VILKGRSRGHGSQLARYLFAEKNDAVKVLELRGACAHELNQNGLVDALKEFDEYGKLTQGQKTIFHLAIAPSELDRMDTSKWQHAVTTAEKALGFEDQPRAVVMHHFEGKDHLHVAWSRVDLEEHKLKSDSFTNLKLVKAAREIELDLGLMRLPERQRGSERARQLDTELKTKQQQERPREPKQREREVQRFQHGQADRSEKELKRSIAIAWHQSENGHEFRDQLKASGLQLVKGDRGPVVMDANRTVFSPARYIEDVKVKDVREKCADVMRELPTVDQARDPFRSALSPRKAQNLIRQKLKQQISNDPKRTPLASFERDDY
jgi:hypothetical protein